MDRINALLETGSDGVLRLLAPRIGRFRPRVDAQLTIRPGAVLGELRVQNRRFSVLAPDGAFGRPKVEDNRIHRPVEYGALLFALEPTEEGAMTASSSEEAVQADGEILAPIHGVFYRRPAPDADPYVSEGDQVLPGQTLGLIESMKTFNPVPFEGAAPVEIVKIEVTDQAEVEAGKPLMSYRKSSG